MPRYTGLAALVKVPVLLLARCFTLENGPAPRIAYMSNTSMYAPSAYRERAELKKGKGDADGAIADLTSAIQLSSETEDYRARSALKRHKGDLNGAIADLTSALLVDPCSAAAFSDLAAIRKEKGDISGAQAAEAQAKQLRANGDLFFGTACERSLQFVVAFGGRDGFMIGVQRANGFGAYPMNSPVAKAFLAQMEAEYAAIAQKDMKDNNWDAAELDLTKAIKVGIEVPGLYLYRGVVRMARGDVDGAVADLGKGIRLQPKSWRLLSLRGNAYLMSKNADAAIADFNASLAINPRFAGSLYGRGIAELTKGDKTKSDEDIAVAKALDPKIADRFVKWGITTPRP